MQKFNNKLANNKYFYICILVIIIYPIFWSFMGLDTADTGSYLYFYQNPKSEYVSLLTYLSVLVGSTWLKLFPSLGLWGLNFLEVLILWLTAYLSYKMLSAKLGKLTTIIGLVIATIITTSYIKIFNFHQFNMLIQIATAYFIYNGFVIDKRHMFFAGLFIGIMPFIRFTAILGTAYIFAILFYCIYIKERKSEILKKQMLLFAGLLVGITLVILLYMYIGIGDRILNELNRVNSMASSNVGLYSSTRLIKYFIFDLSYSLLIAVFVIFLLILNIYIFDKLSYKIKNPIAINIIKLLSYALATFAFFFLNDIYGIYPESWAKMSGYSWMLHGLMMVSVFILTLFSLLKEFRTDKSRLLLISLLGLAAMWLTFVGTGVRFRHVVISVWILMPLFIFVMKKTYYSQLINEYGFFMFTESVNKQASLVLSLLLILSSLTYAATVNMYDDSNILNLNTTSKFNILSNIKTTKRQADALDSIANYVLKNSDKKDKLMVFGNSVILYSMTNRQSFVSPWVVVPSYSLENFEKDLLEKESLYGLPMIVVNRTNPYYGFEKENYLEELTKEASNTYFGKKKIFNRFIKYKYELAYSNEYFILLKPIGGQ